MRGNCYLWRGRAVYWCYVMRIQTGFKNPLHLSLIIQATWDLATPFLFLLILLLLLKLPPPHYSNRHPRRPRTGSKLPCCHNEMPLSKDQSKTNVASKLSSTRPTHDLVWGKGAGRTIENRTSIHQPGAFSEERGFREGNKVHGMSRGLFSEFAI